jgi:hypothetical protein
VVSDQDYLDTFFLREDLPLPVDVSSRIAGKRLLFLGYSLSDWNVRGMIRRIRARRRYSARGGDYLVVRRAEKLSTPYYDDLGLSVVEDELSSFGERLEAVLARRVKSAESPEGLLSASEQLR